MTVPGGLFQYLAFYTLIVFSTSASAYGGIEEGVENGFGWNLQGSAVTFLGNNSYFGESEALFGASTDEWSEAVLELGVQGFKPLGKGAFFGAFSGLFSKTWGDDASSQTIGFSKTEEFDIEQAHIGWRSGDTFATLGKDALTLKAGNFDYVVGTGLLLADGTADGGGRGGWYLSGRTVFRRSFLASLKSGPWKAEGFYLEVEGRASKIRVYGYGGDFEYKFVDAGLSTGLLYLRVPNQEVDGDFFWERNESLAMRAAWAPKGSLSFSGEYVYQSRPGSHPRGWYLEGAYRWERNHWSPEVSYRFAQFDGDDPTTPADESFESAAYGFTDYGYWVQGEISGGYPLDNSNLKSHMLKLNLSPSNNLSLNAVYYDFALDQPNIFGQPVGSTDWGDEVNLTADFTVNKNWALSGVFGWLVPGQAAINWTGGDKTWVYGMIYVSFGL